MYFIIASNPFSSFDIITLASFGVTSRICKYYPHCYFSMSLVQTMVLGMRWSRWNQRLAAKLRSLRSHRRLHFNFHVRKHILDRYWYHSFIKYIYMFSMCYKIWEPLMEVRWRLCYLPCSQNNFSMVHWPTISWQHWPLPVRCFK